MLFTNITGKKETRGFHEALVLATPTVGDFKVTPLAQKQLDIVDGDSVVLLTHPEDNTRVFLAKGIRGEEVRNEDGSIQKDGRGRTVYVENSGFGAVARPASEGSVNLKITGAAAWNAVKGNSEVNKHFTLAEPFEGQVATGRKDEKGDAEIHTAMFFELIFKEEKAKSRKGEGKEKVEGIADADSGITEGPSDEVEFEEEEI